MEAMSDEENAEAERAESHDTEAVSTISQEAEQLLMRFILQDGSDGQAMEQSYDVFACYSEDEAEEADDAEHSNKEKKPCVKYELVAIKPGSASINNAGARDDDGAAHMEHDGENTDDNCEAIPKMESKFHISSIKQESHSDEEHIQDANNILEMCHQIQHTHHVSLQDVQDTSDTTHQQGSRDITCQQMHETVCNVTYQHVIPDGTCQQVEDHQDITSHHTVNAGGPEAGQAESSSNPAAELFYFNEDLNLVTIEQEEETIDDGGDGVDDTTVPSPDDELSAIDDVTAENETKVPAADDELSCHICGRVYTKYFYLKRHITRHACPKPFSCQTCGKKFALQRLLNSHLATHADETQPSEVMQVMTFTSSDFLDDAALINRIDPGVKLETCYGRDISSGRKLKVFSCMKCEETFPKWSLLNDHKLAHTNDTQFVCPVCNATFAQRSGLRRHGVVHKPSKQYKCEDCDREFDTPNSLLKHMKLHDSAKNRGVHDSTKKHDSASISIHTSPNNEHGKTDSPVKDSSTNHNTRSSVVKKCKLTKGDTPAVTNAASPLHNADEGSTTSSTPDIVYSYASGTSPNVYPCEQCQQTFATDHLLIMHSLLHNGTNEACSEMSPECNGSKRIKSDKPKEKIVQHEENHMKTQNPKENVVKRVQVKRMKTRNPKENGIKHTVKRTKIQKPNELIEREGKPKKLPKPKEALIECEVCGSTFVSYRTLRLHLNTACMHRTSKKIVPKMNRNSKLTVVKKQSETRKILPAVMKPTVTRKNTVKREKPTETQTNTEDYSCETCGKSFKEPYQLEVHKLIHNDTQTKSFVCPICPKSFAKSLGLRTHMTTHCENRKVECTVCSRMLSSPALLRRHMILHSTIQKIHICHTCGKEFLRLDHLKSHSLVHSGIKSQICPVCNKAFATRSQLIAHLYIHRETKDFECLKCGKCFRRPSDLQEHRLVHDGVRKFQCDKCDCTFTKLKYLKYHSYKHNPQKEFHCEKCDMWFVNPKALYHHDRINHIPAAQTRVQTKPGVQTKPSVMPGVQSGVQTKPTVMPGVQTKPSVQPCVQTKPSVQPGTKPSVQWTETQTKFRKPIVLLTRPSIQTKATKRCILQKRTQTKPSTHQSRTQTKPSTYQSRTQTNQSPISGRILPVHTTSPTSSLSGLKLRMKNSCAPDPPPQPGPVTCSEGTSMQEMVSNKPDFTCNVCADRFDTQTELIQHVLTHKFGELIHATCPICQKYIKQSMKNHIRLHLGIKKHTCETCNKTFSRRHNLLNHRLVHDEHEPRTCGVCSKVFTRPDSFLRHVNGHWAPKRHVCSVCGMRFLRTEYLRDHMKRNHQIQE